MSNQQPVYLLVQMDVTDPERFGPEYAMPLLQQFISIGAKPLVATGAPELIEGNYERNNTVIIEFPTREIFDTWLVSDEYRPLKQVRAETSDHANTVMMVLPAFDIPA